MNEARYGAEVMRIIEERDAFKLQLEEVKAERDRHFRGNIEGVSEKHKLLLQNDALRKDAEKLSKGLYDRIEARSQFINMSAVETALEYINNMKRLNGEYETAIRRAIEKLEPVESASELLADALMILSKPLKRQEEPRIYRQGNDPKATD